MTLTRDAYDALIRDGHTVEITLNGQPVNGATDGLPLASADEEAGIYTYYDLDAQFQRYVRPGTTGFATSTKMGTVRIRVIRSLGVAVDEHITTGEGHG